MTDCQHGGKVQLYEQQKQKQEIEKSREKKIFADKWRNLEGEEKHR